MEDPTVASLTGEEINAITYEEGSEKDEEDNDVDTLISIRNIVIWMLYQ